MDVSGQAGRGWQPLCPCQPRTVLPHPSLLIPGTLSTIQTPRGNIPTNPAPQTLLCGAIIILILVVRESEACEVAPCQDGSQETRAHLSASFGMLRFRVGLSGFGDLSL